MFMPALVLVASAVCAAILAYGNYRRKSLTQGLIKSAGAAALSLVFLPLLLLAGGSFFLMGASNIHLLMYAGLVGIPIFYIALCEELRSDGLVFKVSGFAVTTVVVLYVISNAILSNAAFLHQQIAYETGISFAGQLQEDLLKSPVYDAESKVITALYNSQADRWTFYKFLNSYGYLKNAFYSPTDWKVRVTESQKKDAAAMPAYPAAGSIARNGEYIFVKLGNS